MAGTQSKAFSYSFFIISVFAISIKGGSMTGKLNPDLMMPAGEQVVYYLVNENRKTATIHKFLELLTEKLKTLPKDKITSFLS
jgi:hypothetical protein